MKQDPPTLLKDMRPIFKEWRAQHPLPALDELSPVDRKLAAYVTTYLEERTRISKRRTEAQDVVFFSSLPGTAAAHEFATRNQFDFMYFTDGEIHTSLYEIYERYFLTITWLKRDYETRPYEHHDFLTAVAQYPHHDPEGLILVDEATVLHGHGGTGYLRYLYWDGQELIVLNDFVGMWQS